jgi:Tfp pilus assembly protein PilO
LAGGTIVNGRGAWLKLWYLWAPAGALVALNVVWLTGLRGSVLGRGSLLAKQVSEAEAGVNKLESQLRQLERTAQGLADLQANLGDLREQRLGPMRERLVPFLQDVVRRTQEAGLQPERVSYTAHREAKTGLVYFTATYGVKGSYDKIRRCVFLLETSPEFVLLDGLGIHGDESASSLDVQVQLNVSTYFSDLDETLVKQLGVKEVTGG